jgi:Mn-dependent DtxR family transcriptional regulator
MTNDDAAYNELKDKITAYLSGLEGKGVDTTVNIAKGIGVKRKEASKILNRMELEGLIEPGGVMAGVAGYKLKG